MRLLLTETQDDQHLKFFTVPNFQDLPPYAILSHTWVENEEVSFQDITHNDPSIRTLTGYKKIIECCRRARKDGFKYVWIDTCCINKERSTELSEAINSMYKWYQMATLCYVYLADVFSRKDDLELRNSRWFTRGWTLQELIAPRVLQFYTADWSLVGFRDNMAETIESISGVDSAILRGISPHTVSVATRMSWAASRQTTRIEDRAYSLMGLFDVNMPTIYGEGERAFTRLQHEIMALSAEHSIFAWNGADDRDDSDEEGPPDVLPILADSPDRFSASFDIVDILHDTFLSDWNLELGAGEFRRTSRGLQVTLPVFNLPDQRGRFMRIDVRKVNTVAVIACKLVDSTRARQYSLGLALRRSGSSHVRVYPRAFVHVDCLRNLGVPWSTETLVLADRASMVESMVHRFDWPRHSEITVGSHTIRTLYDQGLMLVPSPSDSDYEDFTTKYGPVPADLVPNRIEFVKTEAGDFVFTADSDSNGVMLLFVEHSSGNLYDGARILKTSCFMSAAGIISFSCVDRHGSPQKHLESDLYVDNNFGVHKTLQCKCGLVIRGEIVPLLAHVVQNSAIPRYLLDIKRRGDTPWTSDGSSQESASQQHLHSVNYRARDAVQWVEASCGFIPADAIRFKYHSDTRSVARVSYEYILSGLDSDIQSRKIRSNIPACKIKGDPFAICISYPEDQVVKESGLGYEVLAGPADSVRWVECVGEFSIASLNGAIPIEAARDRAGAAIYFIREKGPDSDVGVVKSGSLAFVHSDPASGPMDMRSSHKASELCYRYEVLVYA